MKKIILLVLLVATVFSARSQWSNNPSVNNLVSNKPGGDFEPVSVSDGANGSIIISNDYINRNLYAQRITSTGAIAWGSTSNPTPVCISAGEKWDLAAISDGAGGAFVAWSDYRSDDMIAEIYVQKISSTGVAMWTANGVRVTNNVNLDDMHPLICLDGQGGVIVTWYGDDAVAKTIQNYAQRFNSAGAAQWVANGMLVTNAAGFRASTSILSDGANGAFIFFLDTRNDPNGSDYDYLETNDLTNTDIYGQRLNGSGTRLWGNGGTAIITAPGNQNVDLDWDAVPDGSGNAILVFNDGRNDDGTTFNYDIFAQKVNNNGVPQWTANGVAVCTAAENQFVNDLKPDGAGGVIVSIAYQDIERCYAQRITGTGTSAWTLNGVPVSPMGQIVYGGDLAVDASANSIFTFNEGNDFVKAYKLNSAGATQWGGTGLVVCNNPSNIFNDPVITSSDAGSVIIAWSDNRNAALPSEQDIYASKVLTTGVLAGTGVSSYVTAASGNWNNTSTWVGGVVPPLNAVIIIRHDVTGNVNATCASVTLEAPGKLTVNTGIVISVAN